MGRLGRLLLVLLLLVGGQLVFTAVAQPVRREVLKELSLAKSGPCQRIAVELQFPFTVEGYAPPTKGALLLVRIIPLQSDESLTPTTLPEHEALVPENHGKATPLEEVTFESNGTSGPQLVFRFSHQVAYEVAMASDSRSVNVTVRPKNTEGASCKIEPAPRDSAK